MLKISSDEKKNHSDFIVAGIKIIFFLTALNAIFYSIGYAFSFKTGTYVYTGDYLADILKLSLSYPRLREPIESGQIIFSGFLTPLLDVYYKFTYGGASGLDANELTHFHLPPLTTAIIFLVIESFKNIGFIATIILLIILSFTIIIAGAMLAIENNLDRCLLILLITISYPFIFLLQRGNFFSLFSIGFILIAILRLKQGAILLPTIFIALAINIRPNLILYAVFLYFWPHKSLLRVAITIMLSVLIFFIALYIDNHIYAEYTLQNFLKGLDIYNNLFVIGDWGFGYSTSLFTLLKFIYKALGLQFVTSYAIKLQLVALAVLYVYSTWLYMKNKINDIDFIFLITALSMIGTPVFADYHLLLFVVPAIYILSMQRGNLLNLNASKNKHSYIIFIACCLMLSPLNYINYYGLYAITLLKTILAIAMIVFIIGTKKHS